MAKEYFFIVGEDTEKKAEKDINLQMLGFTEKVEKGKNISSCCLMNGRPSISKTYNIKL